MSRFFVNLFRYFQKHPPFLWGLLILMLILCSYSLSKISFVEDISSFLPQNENNKRINFAYQNIGAANKIVVNIKSADENTSRENLDRELLMDAAFAFAEYITENDSLHHITHLMYEVNQQQIGDLTNFIVENMPYFLSEEDYIRMDSLLTKENIAYQLHNNKKLLLSPAGTFIRNVIVADPLHFSDPLLQGLIAFQLNDQYHVEDGFIFNKEGNELIITITAAYPVSETAQNKLLAKDIENAIKHVESQFENAIDITAFGASLISITNAERIKKDSIIAIGLAGIFILALLIYFFRNGRSLLLIVFSVVFGGLFALGIIVLFKSTISIIAIGIASIIIGIAVNYPIHFLAHYQHNQSKEKTIREIVNPLLIGNITTVGAFLSLLFISSDAMRDLGLFASLLLIGTIFFVLVFLPHFWGKSLFAKKQSGLAFGKLASFTPEKNKYIVWTVVLLTFVLSFFSINTSFETNMHAINYMTKEQRTEFEKIIAESASEYKTVYCIAEGENIDQALSNYEISIPYLDALQADSLIHKKTSIGNYLPSKKEQEMRIARWNKFWENKREFLLIEIEKNSRRENYNPEAFDRFKNILLREYEPQSLTYFDVIQQNLGENYMAVTPEKSLVYTILHIEPENEDIVTQKLNSINGDVFAFDNSSVINRMVSTLSDDFNSVLYICGFIVFAFLLFSFGRIELSLMAFIPLAVAWIWILGLMSIFGMKFNIVNIILATFIFGQGDDYTIFVTEGLLYEYTYRKKMLASFKNSILLSAAIMFLAIGMLIFAQHPAMRSLAEVTMVGMMSVVLMAYIFPPLIFNLLIKKGGKTRQIPVTLWNLVKTVFSFIIFLIGSILITIIGFLVLTIGGKSPENKFKYHQILCVTFRTLAKLMIQVPFKVLNSHNEKFEKPSIIICNHQSHIDLMYTLMLSPKIITLTNEWVWKSPFYGWIIRYADFLPVADGIEQHVDKIEKMVAAGYSILVFPEGTRSEDCSILRFRKGAFYLADKLNLDVVPLLIHGIGHVLPKTEFLLRKGRITIEIGERIAPENPLRKGKETRETAKSVRVLYKKRYAELARQIETQDYFADKVYHNYIYKGAVIERRAKKILKKFNNFSAIISQLPDEGNVLVTNCGQGEFPLLCSLVKKNLRITATESDDELFEIARNCISVPENLSFVKNVYDYENYNIFVLFYPEKELLSILRKEKKLVYFVDSPFLSVVDSVNQIKKTSYYTLNLINGEQ